MEQKPLSERKIQRRHIPFRKLLGYRRLWPLHEFLATRPHFYYPLFTLLGRNKARPIRSDTAMVVAAAGGCGNTYARNCVRFYMPDRHFGSHKHMPLEVIQAARYNVPCLVIIRNPMDSISSVVSRGGYRYSPGSLEWALKDYTLFYRVVADYSNHYVAATFQDVVSDVEAVMDRVNARFGTQYKVPVKGSDDALKLRQSGKWRAENRVMTGEQVKEVLYHEYFNESRQAALETYHWFSGLHGLPTTEDSFRPGEKSGGRSRNAEEKLGSG